MIRIIVFILSLSFSTGVFAQVDDDAYVYGDDRGSSKDDAKKSDGKFDWSRVTVGGGLGATFGDITYFELAPTVGYYLTDNVLVGLGGTYIYYANNVYDYKTNMYGGNVFTQYMFNGLPVLAHAETALMNYYSFNREARITTTAVLLGGGLKQDFGGRSYLSILVLWDINETEDSFYPNPIIRAGIAIGL
ncbi:MAG: hypothetical protein H6588_08795 [Flavobacteriales bacterium]|nr:hypothetical protein [Flavobacteriales bacterium]